MIPMPKKPGKYATLRERRMRARVLDSLRRVRAEQAKGKSRQKAVINSMIVTQRQRFGVKGKPFLKEPEAHVFKKLDRKVLPGKGTAAKRKAIKATRKVFDRRKYYKKYDFIGRFFGPKPRLGILMVKPELYANWREVEAFLKSIGCRIVFTKNFVFAKDDIQRLYPHALADRERYSNFSIPASNLMSGPSKVIVFEHLSAAEYAKKAPEKKVRAKHPQNVFNELFKDVMRGSISRKNLEALGFPAAEGEKIRGIAKRLDLYGFFERAIPEGLDPMLLANGIHVPDAVEVVRDARTLLSLTELERISKKLSSASK
ncbi:MAG: hypothetical protein JW772_04200 [Candidatus Diapherotrites archaeon]|nr:hypothetical protein [Candidatus Diapherotrites archaeon]